MRAPILLLGVAACAPVLTPPDRPLTPTEVRGLAMLNALRAADPCEADTLCKEVRRGN
jgi:hypothetical protein